MAFFVRSNLRQKRSKVLSEPKFGPPSQKFLDPPLGNTITGETSWLFTRVTEDFNSELPKTSPASGQGGH